MLKDYRHPGFTLVELIIVIAIIALLAAATFVAINPAKRVGDANNAQRWADITAIADAYQNYIADNNGTAATTTTDGISYIIATTTYADGETATGVARCALQTGNATTTTRMVDLSALVTAGYIGKIPTDPQHSYSSDDRATLYYFMHEASGKLTIGACKTYNSVDIEIVR